VRKEFRPREEVGALHETELRNLSILKLLRHPNIIEVLSSYAYEDKLNLIFPRAHGGTLKDLLNGPRPEAFTLDTAILVALSGLCSAVRAVHQFFCSSYKLDLIGCHHDLKPANVLVEGSRFLLADFGLSRFKEASESSDTLSRTVQPYYTPPECCESENGERPIVRRSSDIWSLGCIIAEVVTYIRDGAQGVADFERQRVFQEGSYIRHRFHRGRREEPAVIAWIRQRQQSRSRTRRMLGRLVGEILQLEPEKRPRAQEVDEKMRFITVDAVCQPIPDLYNNICTKSESYEPILERARFDSWRDACGVLDFDEDNSFGQWNETKISPLVYETLGHLHDHLEAISLDCNNPRSPIFEPLRQENDLLIDHLSHEGRGRARTYLDTQMMSEPSVAEMATIGESNPTLSRLSIMAAVKCVTELLRRRPAHPADINRSRLEMKKRVGDFQIQYLRGHRGKDKSLVLVESKTYREHYSSPQTAEELHKRLEEITEILQTANRAAEKDSFRVLPCAGFYQDPSACSCGLVYEFPTSSPNEQKFLTLRSALEETQEKLQLQPSLEQRFQLAQTLAGSVFKFHAVSWVQKSISSFNIAFFHAAEEPWLNSIANPFFLGFLNSRSNDKNAFTEGPPTEYDPHRDYQHHDYLRRTSGSIKYRLEYDYYSLGLVLLEIGLWKSLGRILKALNNSNKDPKSSDAHPTVRFDGIMQRCVPRLRLSMGTRYQRVVEICLHGRFEIPDDLEESRQSKLYRSFSRLVVEELAKCKL
jgi:serine/threonine protein kinase